ncbi:MAG: carboxypeptidase regulatory-like domain-containing protein [Planctomycetes bacterium]|nr:carboxypeptidase regulatory-like domain-containing protein [Planctomycetota bacterium]
MITAITHSFRFISERAAATGVFIRQPQYGDRISVDLVAQAAQPGQFEVVGPDQRPLAGAIVHVTIESGRNRREMFSAITDRHGRATVLGLPSEACVAFATASGFFAPQGVAFWPHYLAGKPKRIQMEVAGTLTGRVLQDGRPVEAFEIWCFPESTGGWTVERFESTTDGTFVLREAPPGPAELFASADALGQSDVVHVEIVRSADEVAPVTLPLLSGMRGRGVVVDAVTGDPLESAFVQIWTCAGGEAVAIRHAVSVDALTGAFKTDALSAGTARICVGADGHAARTVSAFGAPGEEVDFGVVRLDVTQPLQLRLVPDGELRLDFCSAAVSTDYITPMRLFDQAGMLDVGSVVAGLCRIELVRADRYQETYQFVLGAEQHLVELPVRIAPGMNVVLDEGAPEGAAAVRVQHEDATGWERTTLGRLDGGREVVLPVAPEGVREVELLNLRAESLLRHEVTAEERAAGVVRIGAAEELLVRVVDRKGVPIEGTSVLVRRVGGSTDVMLDARTGADGLARLAGVGWAQIEVLAFHPQRGVVPSVRAQTAEHRSRPLEIELDAEGRWAIDVRDGDAVLSGVEVRFLDPRHNAGRSVSDAAGRSTSLPFARGRFRAEAGERGYWPSELEVEFEGVDMRSTLQVRRTGSAALELRSSSTPDVRNIELDLESVEFGERASNWIAAGKASSESGLRPDKDGRVRIDGLPRGKYRWRASRAGEVVASGELEVPPHGAVNEKLFIP